ncbi:MAG: NAD(P)/FAD-dependent oxidoreductase [Spirochaetia bacterium]
MYPNNKRIVIAGGGFAGLTALRVLCRNTIPKVVSLIDLKTEFDMLPLIPEVLGGRIKGRNVSIEFRKYCRKHGAGFIHAAVQRLDIKSKNVLTNRGAIPFDYLLISTGAVVNFHNQLDVSKFSHTLRSRPDAEQIQKSIISNPHRNWVIAGGGYTGIEAATQIRRFTRRMDTNPRIVIVEKNKEILTGTDEWIREYVIKELDALDIEINTGMKAKIDSSNKISFSDGSDMENGNLVWTAGVKAPSFLANSRLPTGIGGRVKADTCLNVQDQCWAAGDTALVYDDDRLLPMFSYHAQHQGNIAAENILRAIQGEEPIPYKPVKYGFVIPLANGKAAGEIRNRRVKGVSAILIHHGANIYRSHTWKNRFGIISDLLRQGLSM